MSIASPNRKGYLARLTVILILIAALSGCATKGAARHEEAGHKGFFSGLFSSPPPPETTDETKLAKEAMGYFDIGRYLLAQDLFQKLKDRFPFSPYATLAELRLADCKFYEHLYEEAIPLYEEFEKLHPTNEAIPYVIFQEGTCYYELMDSADRDQTYTHKAIETYERLLKRYPDSPYSYEARKRVAEARNRLGEHEIVVAKWYMQKDQLPQARERLEAMLDKYPETPSAAQARRLLKKVAQRQAHGASAEEPASWWRRLVPFM